MLSALDAPKLVGGLPVGVPPGTDLGSMTAAVILGLDVAQRLAQVSVDGSEGVWVPAQPAIYTKGDTVRVLRAPLDGGRLVACLGPLSDAPLIVTGTVSAVNSSVGTLTVSVLGATVDLPYSAGTYTKGAVVHVMRDPARFGAPIFVLGPQGNFSGSEGSDIGGGSDNTAQVERFTRVILPQWSGSWRSAFSRWDSWNTDRYGGRSTLWQGNAYGSGAMTGLAAYGDQVANLGAIAIERMAVVIARADSSTFAGRVAVVQGSPNGSQPPGAPSASGDTASSPALTPGAAVQIELPGSMYEGFRTGALKGLCTVGGDYAGFAGTSRGDGMALTVQYTKAK